MPRAKYKGYFYSTRKDLATGKFKWYLKNKEGEILDTSDTNEDVFDSKRECELAAQESIDEMYHQ